MENVWFQWAAGSSSESAECEVGGGDAEVLVAPSAPADCATELPRTELKPDAKPKADAKAEPKAKPESKAEPKAKPEPKAAAAGKPELKESSKSGSEAPASAASPAARRRASSDAGPAAHTPERKKRRLTRPRKLWARAAAARRLAGRTLRSRSPPSAGDGARQLSV